MCGIVSMILKDQTKVLGKEYSEMFKQMLHADAVRGWDSTGIACVKHKGEVQIIKDALVPSELFDFNPDQKWIYQNRAYIGHNRWATRGKTNADNAHPFHEGNITLVHNGTLRFHMFLKNVEVDSHAITHAIAEKGAIDTLEILDGAYALVWYDETTGYIHATRNEERPLFLLETEDLFLLSSERGLVYWICERFKIKVRKCSALQPGVVYTFRENKKHATIIEQTKYAMLPPFAESYQYKQPPLLPNPNVGGNVHQLKPYMDPNPLKGLMVGQTIEVLPFLRQDMGYKCFNIGSTRWTCDSVDYPDIKIELYTDEDQGLYNTVVAARITNMYAGTDTTGATIICKMDDFVEKKTDAEPDCIRSTNGVAITAEVKDMCKDLLCNFCSEPFIVDKGINLIPIMANGHTYKYRYYCPDCNEMLIQGKGQLHSVH